MNLLISNNGEMQRKNRFVPVNAADPDRSSPGTGVWKIWSQMDEITKAIRHKVPAQKLQKRTTLTKIQKEWLKKRLDKSDFGERMRLHYYLGVVLEDENEIQECFHIIQAEMLEATVKV